MKGSIIFWIFMNLLLVGIQLYFFGLMGLIEYSMIVLCGTIIYFLFRKKVMESRDKLKTVGRIQAFGFGFFLFWLLFSDLFSDWLRGALFFIWVGLVVMGISLRRQVMVKGKAGDSLEDRVRKDLKVHSKVYRKNFIPGFNWVGGFIMPAFPFFTMINKRWKKRLDSEAIIHEHVHLYYLQNGFVFAMLVFVLAVTLTVDSLTGSWILGRGAFYVSTVLTLVFFEYITFNKTRAYAANLGIAARKWDARIGTVYFMVYAVQVAVISIVVTAVWALVRALLRFLFGLF